MERALLETFAAVLLANPVFGQAGKLHIESIQPSPNVCKAPTDMKLSGGRLQFRSEPLMGLLMMAYEVEKYQIAGPEWMATQCFDIDATVPQETEAEDLPEIVQAILADRFKLVVHRESKTQSVYALIAGKGGSKLKESGPNAGSLDAPLPKDRTAVYVERTPDGLRVLSVSNGRLRFDADKISLPQLALFLLNYVEAPVLDLTGLNGYYQVSFEVPPPKGGKILDPTLLGRSAEITDSAAISIFSSVDALGLKLEKRKLPIDHVIVDHLEKVPTEN